MEIEIRPCESDEVPAACAVWHRADAARTGHEPSEEEAEIFARSMLEAADKPGARLLVGVTATGIMATIYGVPLRTDATKAQVALLGVEPSLWGQCLGGKMLDALTDMLAQQGCRHLRMNVHPDNVRARALYERRGWRHMGETERVGQVGELIYRTELQDVPGG